MVSYWWSHPIKVCGAIVVRTRAGQWPYNQTLVEPVGNHRGSEGRHRVDVSEAAEQEKGVFEGGGRMK